MATHSSILAWRTPWTEGPGGLQSMGSQRVRHGERLRAQALVTSVTAVNPSFTGFMNSVLTVA